MEKCPICQNEYDNEQYSSCPVCNENEEHSHEDIYTIEETTENISQQEDENAPEEESTKPRTALSIIIAVLSVLVVLAVALVLYLSLSTVNVPDTINPKTFALEDMAGTYTDKTSGQYIAFTREAVEIDLSALSQIPDGDTEASSDASIPSEKQESEMKAFHGTFETGYIKESIKTSAIRNFIVSQNLGAQYIDFVCVKNIKGDAFEEFLKENGLEEDFELFEETYRITNTLEEYSLKGYWDYEDKSINLYDETGSFLYSFMVTKNGLSVSDAIFAGKAERGRFGENVFSYTNEQEGYVQSIHTYNDGRLILSSEQSDGTGQLNAGTYCISDNVLSISMTGSLDQFSLTDFGITPFLFNK